MKHWVWVSPQSGRNDLISKWFSIIFIAYGEGLRRRTHYADINNRTRNTRRQRLPVGHEYNSVITSYSIHYTKLYDTYFRDQSFNGKYVGSDTIKTVPETTTKVYGARLGGPIIKNKLFFFVNGEQEKSTVPGVEWLAAKAGRDATTNPNVTRVNAADLEEFSALLKSKYGYETGPYENYGSFGVEN